MLKIYVSPSCQDKNLGYGAYGTEERVMNLIADAMLPLLLQNGFEVRRNRPEMALSQVVQEANGFMPNLHVALHSNAYNGNARGMEVWHNPKGITAAKCVYDTLDKCVPCKNRGIKQGTELYELNSTKHPALLIEYDFHDTPEGAAFILENIERLAAETVKGICAYFSIPYVEEVHTHWAEKSYKKLNEMGLVINERRFDEPLKRGEAFALLERLLILMGPDKN